MKNKNVKKMEKPSRNFPLVLKADVRATLNMLKPGQPATYDSARIGTYMKVYSAIYRMNAASGFEEFTMTTPDNGATMVITRNEK